MKSSRLLTILWLFALIVVSGCAGIQVAGDVQAGRNALHTGRSSEAVGYFERAAGVDPAYKIPYRIPVGVLTYLGRAYYEIGKDAEARKALEQSLSLDKEDSLARLYLGLVLLRSGSTDSGRKEIENGLKGLHETLEYIASDNVYGFYWDPARTIRTDIEKTLASKLNNSQLTVAAVHIGSQFEEEIDKARRDQLRRRRGSSGGGGE